MNPPQQNDTEPATLSIAYAFQDLEYRAAAQSRCSDCRRELAGRPAFGPDCGARSRY